MPYQRYNAELLRRIRNDIPIAWLIKHLRWPCKMRMGQFVFVCPDCGETTTSVNPRTNLARCYPCQKNFNTIEFTMFIHQARFVDTIEYLIPLLPK